MVKAAASPILQLIGRAVEDRRVRDLPDQELLQRFHAQLDEATFHALLRRHGPMVLDVCRGVLGNETDAEDAFQATFLVFARKAGSIRKSVSVGSWLHGVAHRTALKARAQSATRQKHEARAPVRAASEVDDLSWREVRQVLQEELSRLPERYRAPLVLCYLEGATQEAAAVQLGLPRSTLRERLERGRALLRTRLVRRGLGPAALLAAAAWPAANASASVPLSVLVCTAKAGAGMAAGQVAAGLVSAKVAALAEGMVKTMFVTKLKTAAVGVLAVLLAGAGTGTLTYRTLAAAQPGGTPAAPTSQAPTASDAARIAKLINQLGSDTFAEREKATKELDQLGAPALDALRKTSKSGDPERKTRAENLVQTIERRELEATMLAPKRVHLVYQDTPVAEAVADFARQSGYELMLSDPEGKLKGRTITLDTGDVTFWQALDQFCQKAGLIESTPQPAEVGELPPYPRIPGQQADQQQGAVGPGRAAMKGNGIILADGKALQMPTDNRTSVRVRAEVRGRIADGKEILLTLQITPEPKLHGAEIALIRIKRAIDNRAQNLEPVLAGDVSRPPVAGRPLQELPRDPPYPPGPAASGRHDSGLVRLKRGTVAATSLAELSGTITLRVAQGQGSANKAMSLDMPFTLKNVPLP